MFTIYLKHNEDLQNYVSKHKEAQQLDFKFNLKAGQTHTNLLNYILLLGPNHVFNDNLHNLCNL